MTFAEVLLTLVGDNEVLVCGDYYIWYTCANLHSFLNKACQAVKLNFSYHPTVLHRVGLCVCVCVCVWCVCVP